MIDNLKIWNDCVSAAKDKLGKKSDYQIIKGSLLKEAQRAYYAIQASSK